MENEYSLPIKGCFTSKRGTIWNFIIYKDLTVEQWHTAYKKSAGGYQSDRDVFAPKATQELIQYIKEKYGLVIK